MNYFTYDYATILPYSTISSLLNKNEQSMTMGRYRLPQMGEEGCGSHNPTRFFINFLQFFMTLLLLFPERTGRERDGKKMEDLSFCSFLACL